LLGAKRLRRCHADTNHGSHRAPIWNLLAYHDTSRSDLKTAVCRPQVLLPRGTEPRMARRRERLANAMRTRLQQQGNRGLAPLKSEHRQTASAPKLFLRAEIREGRKQVKFAIARFTKLGSPRRKGSHDTPRAPHPEGDLHSSIHLLPAEAAAGTAAVTSLCLASSAGPSSAKPFTMLASPCLSGRVNHRRAITCKNGAAAPELHR
jgi:hypothetical protein